MEMEMERSEKICSFLVELSVASSLLNISKLCFE